MSEFTEALRAVLDEVMADAAERMTDPRAVLEVMRREHADLMDAEAQRLVDDATLRAIKRLTKDEATDDGQLDMFGFPSVFTVPTETGYALVRWDRVVLADLDGQRALMAQNVLNAQARLDAFDAAVERVRGLMEGGMTLGEAHRALTARDVSSSE